MIQQLVEIKNELNAIARPWITSMAITSTLTWKGVYPALVMATTWIWTEAVWISISQEFKQVSIKQRNMALYCLDDILYLDFRPTFIAIHQASISYAHRKIIIYLKVVNIIIKFSRTIHDRFDVFAYVLDRSKQNIMRSTLQPHTCIGLSGYPD